MKTMPGDLPIILLVDDDDPTRFLLRKILEREGFQIIDAENGAVALKIVETVSPDLVLLDIQMPLVDGIQTCAQLRLRPDTRHTPILMLTGMADDAAVERAFSVGATDFLTKPPNPVTLRHRVARVVAGYRAERQLRDAEARIQSVVRHASDCIVMADEYLTIVSANPATERLFRYSAQSLLGVAVPSLLDLPPESIRDIQAPVETEGRIAGGQRIPVEVTSGSFVSGGKPFFTLIIRDLTERRKIEAQLRNSRQLLRTTFDTLPAHIAILDRDGTILEVNESWRRFAEANGGGSNFGIGLNYLEICDAATGPNADEALKIADGIRQVIAGQLDEYTLEYPCHGPDENRWFVAHIAHQSDSPDSPVVIAHEDTTLQHLAEEGLRKANRFMNHVLEAIPSGIAVIDTTGRIRFSNWNLSRIAGTAPREMFTRRFTRFVGREGRLKMKSAVRKLRDSETEVAEFDTTIRRKDGCFAPVRLSLVRVRGEQTILAIVEDLSERRALTEVLRRRDEEWVATVDAIPDFILLENADGTLRRCNNAVAELFGLPYRDFLGKTAVELFFGDSIASVKTIRDAIGDKEEFQFPGIDRWFEINSYWIPQERGIGTGWVHIIKDITVRRLADHAMRQLTTAIEQIAESVVMLNGVGRIQFVNPAFERTAGFQRWEVYGRRIFSLSLGPVDRSVRREIARTLTGGKDWHGIYTARRKDGALYQEEASMSPVLDAEGRIRNIVAVCRDVTAQLRYESIAEAVNVMDTAGYIFSGIRHEMGNPINSIKTALSVLNRTENPSPETVSKYLDRSLIKIGRVEYLLRTLRSFSMFETPAMEALDIVSFLERFRALVEEDFTRRGIRIVREFEPSTALAWFDQRGLHQALLNLFTNAADAMTAVEAPTLTLKIAKSQRLVTITVRDNGVGLTNQQASELFKPFFTSKPHGTGLGLVISKKLIAKMNGTIDITSNPAGGCDATVTLESCVEDDGP